jgi:drug/metabolite transporter (DMT)-like permease
MTRAELELHRHDEQKPIGPTVIALNMLTAALWGGTPVAVHYSVEQLPPLAVSAIRFSMAAVFMLLWCRFEAAPLRLKRSQLRPTIIMGVMLFAQIALFTVGIAKTNSSHSSVLINTYIFWVAGLEHFVTRTLKLDPLKVAGLLIATVGGLVVLGVNDAGPTQTGQDPSSLTGDLILIASAFILGIKTIYTKVAARTVPPGTLILWHDIIGATMLAAWSFAFEEVNFHGLRTPTILGLLYQGVVVAGFCFALQAYLLKHHSASKISIYSMATPIFGIIAAWAFRGDPLSPWLFASALLVAIGILIVNFEPAEKAPSS